MKAVRQQPRSVGGERPERYTCETNLDAQAQPAHRRLNIYEARACVRVGRLRILPGRPKNRPGLFLFAFCDSGQTRADLNRRPSCDMSLVTTIKPAIAFKLDEIGREYTRKGNYGSRQNNKGRAGRSNYSRDSQPITSRREPGCSYSLTQEPKRYSRTRQPEIAVEWCR